MDKQFSQHLAEVMIYSKEEAIRLYSDHIGPEHLFLGLIRDGEGAAIDGLLSFKLNLKELRNEVEKRLEKTMDDVQIHDEHINFDAKANRVLKLSILEAKLYKSDVVDVEHLLLAIMRLKDNFITQIMEEKEIDYDKMLDALRLKTDTRAGFGFEEEDEDEEEEENSGGFTQGSSQKVDATQKTQEKKSTNDTPVLNRFSIDLTRAAEEGKIDPLVGREKEVERLVQILSRRKKNNPVLIGEPGVGKTAIVEGLAIRIAEKKVSRTLFGKRLLSLDLTALVAGTKFRGQYEERIQALLQEIRNNPHIIVFIDELHTLVGSGSAQGSSDASNMLKPALARGEMQCIGATTLEEYRKNIEKDGALDRRFQKIVIEPSSMVETLQILRNIKDKYEDYHNVSYTDESLEACVKLAARYISDRSFPDKAIDAMDEAGARMQLMNIVVPKEIEQQEALIDEMKNLKNEAVRLQNFELAASYRDKEKACTEQLEVLKAEWEKSLKERRETVDTQDMAHVVSLISGVPVNKMAQEEGTRLKNMREDLTGKVIGQDEAITTLVKAIQRNRIGLKDPNRPIGSFLFLGPTGVGKTHLAKELATWMFGSEDELIRIDMSEYTDRHSVSRLIGAPPGFLGYDDAGQLTEKVRRKPYSIVLLDEIEKADPGVFNIFLQLLDDGRMTDGGGRTVDFKNTIIIMTSNVGSRDLKELGASVGFTGARVNEKERTKGVINKALNRMFAPEFLNRLDAIINFDSLEIDSVSKIAQLELNKLCKRVEDIGYKLVISEEAKEFLVKKGFDKLFGARPLKRVIQSNVEDLLAEIVLGGTLQPGETIHINYNAEKSELETSTDNSKPDTM
ncbi:MAG: ATP-dependent Clp protease ATP-binding subunit [Phocaeicola sp.]